MVDRRADEVEENMSRNLDFYTSRDVRIARGDVPMSRDGECRFSIPRVYFVLQSRNGNKEDRRALSVFS